MWEQTVRDPAAILLFIKGASRSGCCLGSEALWSFSFCVSADALILGPLYAVKIHCESQRPLVCVGYMCIYHIRSET